MFAMLLKWTPAEMGAGATVNSERWTLPMLIVRHCDSNTVRALLREWTVAEIDLAARTTGRDTTLALLVAWYADDYAVEALLDAAAPGLHSHLITPHGSTFVSALQSDFRRRRRWAAGHPGW